MVFVFICLFLNTILKMTFDKDKQLTSNELILEGNIAIAIFNCSKPYRWVIEF